MIKQYSSVAAMRQDYIDLDASHRDSSSGEWYNHESTEETLDKALRGDMKLVPKAEKLMESLSAGIEVPRRVWEASVAGAYPCVPDVIRGVPRSMRRSVEVGDEHAPISIYVASTCSSGISAQTMLDRGVTILALVMALSRIRPISLYTVALMEGTRDGTGECILSARINTDPLDVAQACYTLTSAGFARKLTYGLGEVLNGFTGRWPRNFDYRNPQRYYDYIVKHIAHDPNNTLFIGAARYGDELLSNPIEWVRKQIKFFTNREGDCE